MRKTSTKRKPRIVSRNDWRVRAILHRLVVERDNGINDRRTDFSWSGLSAEGVRLCERVRQMAASPRWGATDLGQAATLLLCAHSHCQRCERQAFRDAVSPSKWMRYAINAFDEVCWSCGVRSESSADYYTGAQFDRLLSIFDRTPLEWQPGTEPGSGYADDSLLHGRWVIARQGENFAASLNGVRLLQESQMDFAQSDVSRHRLRKLLTLLNIAVRDGQKTDIHALTHH